MKLREGLPPLPAHMQALKLDERGYPIPYFVGYIDGKPDFRYADPVKLLRCVKFLECWICGGRTGRFKAFNVGPMAAINQVSAEPPSHLECAQYAARVCPFLVHPRAKRREANAPEQLQAPVGNMMLYNPGVAAVYITKSFMRYRVGENMMFRLGEPERIEWWREARIATAQEALEAFEHSAEELRKMAAIDANEVVILERRIKAARAFLPT